MEEKIWGLPAAAGGSPVRETKIYYGHQYLDEADYQAVLDVLKSDALTCGPKSESWRNGFAALRGRSMPYRYLTAQRLYISPALLRVWARGMR